MTELADGAGKRGVGPIPTTTAKSEESLLRIILRRAG
jgi:hypothetical protein